MKVLLFLILIFGLNIIANAQACGYTFLTIYLKDSVGNLIKNAKFENFDKDFKNEYLLYSESNEAGDRLKKNLGWSKEKQAYFGSEGMCGGHRGVGLRISAEGYEKFEKVIDLPLGWTSYSITLKRIDFNESVEVVSLTHFQGKVIDENDALIIGAKLEITDKQGKKYFTKSDSDGWFEIDLSLGKYTVKVSQNGFKDLKLINFNIENSQRIYLDFKLKVRGCDDCKNSIYAKGFEPEIQEVTLDFQKIKEK